MCQFSGKPRRGRVMLRVGKFCPPLRRSTTEERLPTEHHKPFSSRLRYTWLWITGWGLFGWVALAAGIGNAAPPVTESGWHPAGTPVSRVATPANATVRSDSRATNLRSMELVLPELSIAPIRPVAAQEVWSPERAATTGPQSRLNPEDLIPRGEGRGDTSGRITLPDNSTHDLSTPKTDSGDSAEAPATPLGPNSSGGTAPRAPSVMPPQPRPLPPTKSEGSRAAKNSPKEVIPKATTAIDRSGNYGSIGDMTGIRSDDGTLLGNPYANGNYDYSPRSFAVNPNAQTRIRTSPPVESYGVDGYGNPSGAGCGMYSGIGCAEEYGLSSDGGLYEGYGAYEGYAPYGEMYTDEGYGYADCGGCGACMGCGGCFAGLVSWLKHALQNGEAEAGVFAFRDPLAIGTTNRFGVDLGFNWTTPSRILFGLTAQAGGRFTQTGKEEYFVQGLEESSRSQFFWTAGLFYRKPGDPWQFGAVYDQLRDQSAWTYTVGQARVELSRQIGENTDFGFRGAFRLDEKLLNFWNPLAQDVENFNISVKSYYTGFFRHTFVTGAEGVLFGGATEESEGLLGGHLEVPVTNHSSLRNSFVYVFPKSKPNDLLSNSWSVNITWCVYFGGNSRAGMTNPLRPMFTVADNTSLLQRVK